VASLISDSEKADMVLALEDVFDTFKRPLVVYLEPEKIIASTDPNFSRFGQRDQNVYQPKVNPIRHTIYAVVSYEKELKNPTSEPMRGEQSAQLKLRYADGNVRIKLDKSGFNLMKGAKIIELDGQNFEVDSTPRVHGLFGTGRYTLFLNNT